MLGRLIRKFIIALSVAMALALVGLAICSRRADLVLSVARDGGYHELRSDRTHVSMTHITRWALNEPPSWGRAGEAKIDPNLFMSRRPGQSAARPLANIVLLDRIEVTFMPVAATNWWPPFKTEGTAVMPSPTLGSSGSATLGTGTSLWASNGPVAVASASSAPGKVVVLERSGRSLPRLPTTLPGGFGFTFPTNTLPSLANASPSDKTGDQMLDELKGLTNLTIRPAPKTPAPKAPGLLITTGSITFAAANTFERYALPYWAMIVVVLSPVWIALLMSGLRWRRRASRRRRGLCVSCGYDLRGKPDGACPECGESVFALVSSDAA